MIQSPAMLMRFGAAGLACVLGLLVALRPHVTPYGTFDAREFSPAARVAADIVAPELAAARSISPVPGLHTVHAVSLAETPDGTLHAVWYGGSTECVPDVALYHASKPPGSAAWSAQQKILDVRDVQRDFGVPVYSMGNAVLLPNPDGSLRLLFTSIVAGRWSGSSINTCLSRDGGRTWSKPEKLFLNPAFNLGQLVRQRPVPLEGGGWCVPIYQSVLAELPELLWLREDPHGLIYRKSRIWGGNSVTQPTLVPTGPQTAVALLRNTTAHRRMYVSTTADGGRSWSAPKATNLPNADTGTSGILLPGGRLLTAFNDSEKDRSNLSLAVSDGDPTFWRRVAKVADQRKAYFAYAYFIRTTREGLIMGFTSRPGDEGTDRTISVLNIGDAWLQSPSVVSP